MPEIKLPRRGEKTEKKAGDKELTISLKAIQGTLRPLGEKDMLLETKEKGVVRFRLLAKTQFQNKDGEAVRDSLLKPGDQLKVSVNSDDEETAFRVVLLRTGTAAERASASKPVDAGSVKPPEGLSSDASEPASKTASEARRSPRRMNGPSSSGNLPRMQQIDLDRQTDASRAPGGDAI